MNRRHFLTRTSVATLPPELSLRAASGDKFFKVEQRKDPWWLIKPDGTRSSVLA